MDKRIPKVKIVGGKFRGINISFQPSRSLRPTSNKTRETLFNWLMHDIKNSNCLDMFAGTGSLGIEAISRGANSVCFVEKNKKIFNNLSSTLSNLGITDQSKMLNGNSLEICLDREKKDAYDIVFLDPPFGKNIVSNIYRKLVNKDLIHKRTLIYVEVEKNTQIDKDLNEWKLIKHESSSQTRFGLFKMK